MRALAIALLLTSGAAAEEPAVGSREWMKERTADAIIISRIAGRACAGMGFDERNAHVGAEHYGYRSLDDLPQGKVVSFMQKFAADREAACDFAWRRYGPGDPSVNRGLKFLYRSEKSPFAD